MTVVISIKDRFDTMGYRQALEVAFLDNGLVEIAFSDEENYVHQMLVSRDELEEFCKIALAKIKETS